MKILNEIKEKLLSSGKTALVCHQNPDGDTLGSAFALSETLDILGKNNDVCCADALPEKYSFMDGVTICNELTSEKYDLIVFVDCAEPKLAGSLVDGLDMKQKCIINIDHHGTNTKYADINYVDSASSSTAEIIQDLIKIIGVKFTKSIAEYLYVGMVTDTGQFAYSYTSARTHEHAAFLLECGVDFSRLHKILFNRMPLNKLLLTKQMLQNLEMYEDGKIAVSLLGTQDFKESGAAPEDSDSLVNMILNITGVKAAALIRQLDTNLFKASLRSDDDTDISKAAKIMGGGGHKQASGATIECLKPDVIKTVLDAIDKAEIIK
jgi:phosphoesterase RecJ-like protein